MNKREKEVIMGQLESEKAVLKDIERMYKRALADIDARIKILQADDTPSRAYQIDYQKALKAQVEAIIDKLHADQYDTIHKYLSDSYTDGYVGSMYTMGGKGGIHVITPIDQNAAFKAIVTDSKLSTDLYSALGYDMKHLKKRVREEITRGIATSLPYEQIARNISHITDLPIANANRIVRTEGHRIQQESADDARQAAKAKGADVVKQWDASLDGATRPLHRELDGQIREVDEPFEAGGKKVMYPGKFGTPDQDCNCRCVALTRARWALDEKELETLKERAAYFELDKTKDFEDYKKKYLKATKTMPAGYEVKPLDDEMAIKRKAAVDHFKDLGAIVDEYGNVTLYHATDKTIVPKIMQNGFKPTDAPINGGAVEAIKERVFFGYDKEWVSDRWSAGGEYEIMEVKIPAEYLHQAGKNVMEVFVEGTIKNNNGVWIPDTKPTSIAWDRKLVKRWQKKAEKAAETVENKGKSGIIKKGNTEVRKWYLDSVSHIPDDIDPALPMEEKAVKAFEARNRIRTEAREMMADEETRKRLDQERPNKTFEELVESKMKRKGMTREEAIEDIYKTATKTNENVNRELGLED